MGNPALIRVVLCYFGLYSAVRADSNNSAVTSAIFLTTFTYDICPENADGETCDTKVDRFPTLYNCEGLSAAGFDCRGCRCGRTTTTPPPPNTTIFITTTITNATPPVPKIAKNCSFDLQEMPTPLILSLYVLPVLWVVLSFLAIFADIFLKCCCNKKRKEKKKSSDEEEEDQDSLNARVERTMFEHSNMGKMLFFSVKRSWQKFNKRNRPPPKPEAEVLICCTFLLLFRIFLRSHLRMATSEHA